MPVISIRLPEALDSALEQEARLEQKPRSEVARQAIADYLKRMERARFMAQLVAEAKAGYADEATRKEAIEIGDATADDGLDAANAEAGDSEPWWR